MEVLGKMDPQNKGNNLTDRKANQLIDKYKRIKDYEQNHGLLKRVKKSLNDEGFNKKERAYVIGGAVTGVLTPIVGLKYLISSGIESSNPWVEIGTWGASIIGNLISLTKPLYSPLIYGFTAGLAAGNLAASSSKRKRDSKKYLSEGTKYIKKSIENEDSENLRESINFYRDARKTIPKGLYSFPKLRKKYDKKVSNLTLKLDSVPID